MYRRRSKTFALEFLQGQRGNRNHRTTGPSSTLRSAGLQELIKASESCGRVLTSKQCLLSCWRYHNLVYYTVVERTKPLYSFSTHSRHNLSYIGIPPIKLLDSASSSFNTFNPCPSRVVEYSSWVNLRQPTSASLVGSIRVQAFFRRCSRHSTIHAPWSSCSGE
jgi:hypothetical protein